MVTIAMPLGLPLSLLVISRVFWLVIIPLTWCRKLYEHLQHVRTEQAYSPMFHYLLRLAGLQQRFCYWSEARYLPRCLGGLPWPAERVGG